MSKGRPRRTIILFELFKIEIRVNRSILLSVAQIVSPRADAPVALTRLKANSVISFQNLAAHMTSLVEQWRHCLAGISNIRKYYRKLINKMFFICILVKIFNQKTLFTWNYDIYIYNIYLSIVSKYQHFCALCTLLFWKFDFSSV